MAKSGFIAVLGRPNVGKSTLINRLLGLEISVVSPKPQTTRERVLGILTEKQGQIVFIDTPGIHNAKPKGINAFMVGEATRSLDGPVLIWYMIDPDSKAEHEQLVWDKLKQAKCPVYVILNKLDLKLSQVRANETERWALDGLKKTTGIVPTKVLQISARNGLNVDELLNASWDAMPEGKAHFFDPDQVSDRPTRFFVAEMIRKHLFLCLGDEIPYSCAVEIGSFKEEDPALTRIEANIHVERDSQKGMVIGDAGKKIKEIGSEARRDIEAFLDKKVFLGLKVNVLKDWSKREETLKRLGYNLPDQTKKKKNKKHG